MRKKQFNIECLKQAVCILLIIALFFSQAACTAFSNKAKDAANTIGDVTYKTAGTISDSAKTATDVVSSGVEALYSKITAPKDSDEFEAILDNITPQVIAAFISEIKAIDFNEMLDQLGGIESEIDGVKSWLAEPQRIGGDIAQKHGTIAERLDVSARNTKRIAEGLEPDAKWIRENVDVDYFIGGNAVQSKFYNSTSGTLRAILESYDKYPNWGKDGSYYVIPKDQYAVFEQVMKSNNLALENIEYNRNRLSLTTLEGIKRAGDEIVKRTGQEFDKVVRPSEFSYEEVQLDTASRTLDALEKATKNKSINTLVSTSLRAVGKASLIGAGIDTVISCGYSIYTKTSDGKSIESFTADDWKDVGFDSLLGTARGSGTGASTELFCIFGMPAPIAAVVVSTIFQTSLLYIKYSNGEITLNKLLIQSIEAAADSTVLAAGAIVGQMVIPVPIVGMLVGNVATAIVVAVAKEFIPVVAIGETAQLFADNFSVRLKELIANTSDIGGSTVSSSKTTLTVAYNSTASFVADAIVFANEKVNKR